MAKTTNTTPTATFSEFTPSDNWVTGICGDYTFSAKLFDEGSQFGIKGGRVSKLSITKVGTLKLAVNYDRGWDVKPDATTKPYYKAIMTLLENAPKRFS